MPDVMADVMDPGFHCARTHWIRGFMAFQLARRTRLYSQSLRLKTR
jgi:hypothetical protein